MRLARRHARGVRVGRRPRRPDRGAPGQRRSPPRSTNDRTPTRSASPPRRGAFFSAATPHPRAQRPTFAYHQTLIPWFPRASSAPSRNPTPANPSVRSPGDCAPSRRTRDLPGDPAERRAGGSLRIDGDEVAVAETSGPLEWATSTSWPRRGGMDRVARRTPARRELAVTMDRATVFDPPASWEAAMKTAARRGRGRGRGRRAAGSLGRERCRARHRRPRTSRGVPSTPRPNPGGPTPPPSPPPRLNGRARPTTGSARRRPGTRPVRNSACPPRRGD